MKNFLVLAVLAVLAGCQNYSFSLNNKQLYTPQPLFKQYRILDPQLAGCVAQTIRDQNIKGAAELRQLNCSYAGIEQLDGLEVFYKLESLNLGHNKLSDVKVLLQLSDLQGVALNNNTLSEAAFLLDLPHLKRLNLQANSALACEFKALPKGLNISLPSHCLDD